MGEPSKEGITNFKTLFLKEQSQLGADISKIELPVSKATEEPWVNETPYDQVGLALSGGGIRSATFNLGLLQTLQEWNLLGHIDYLSTVSGGGYIGSFWTRWRNTSAASREPFPSPKYPPEDYARDPGANAVRHLREFSRFLIPRIDFLETELWMAVAKFVSGLLFSLLFGFAVIAGALLLWGWLAGQLLYPNPEFSRMTNFVWSLTLFGLGVAGTFVGGEIMSTRHRKVEADPNAGLSQYVFRALIIWLMIIAAWGLVLWSVEMNQPSSLFQRESYHFPWKNFLPSLLMLGMFFLVAARRLAPLGPEKLRVGGVYDRIQARIFSLGVIWAVLAALWELSAFLRLHPASPVIVKTGAVPLFGGTAAGLAALFAAMRKWIVGTQEDRLKGGFKISLKQQLPRLVASAAVLLLVITIAMMWGDTAETLRWRTVPWDVAVIPVLVVLFILTCVDQKALSLHEFYRARLARCYLGAANPFAEDAADNRQTFERRDDDMPLEEDKAVDMMTKKRIVHLICCAANTLGDDRLSTLYRGARSAVLSRNGMAIGDAVGPLNGLKLSSALTASAAAFNSNMGRRSILYGRASCFLMTMLNLRLGLWVHHPQGRSDFDWFDTSLFRELLGLTKCIIKPRELNRGRWCQPVIDWARRPPFVHLSDGGHFENLGLYELIRRHCRYIIVSDSAADPGYSFGDLANAVRRVREDFGVEIEINTDPLRPGPEGFSPRHVVVGTIHYDGPNGIDKGVILFFKPVLTGDEPTDILEYRRSNREFPQQSTGDQFYSEAQWESYRRLGEHAMHAHLRELGDRKISDAQRLFRYGRLSAEQVPWFEDETYARVSDRCNDLEEMFEKIAPTELQRELFPELKVTRNAEKPIGPPSAKLKIPPTKSDTTAPESVAEDSVTANTFFVLIRVLQTLEEVADACDLYSFWSHPLAIGWMNYVHRWTNLPTLHRFWPVLKPLFAAGLGDFLEERCGLPRARSSDQPGASRIGALEPLLKLRSYTGSNDEALTGGRAGQQFFSEPGHREYPKDTRFIGADLLLPGASKPIQIGLACITINDGLATWDWDDLYTANDLRGGGFTSWLLDRILDHMKDPASDFNIQCRFAEVSFDAAQPAVPLENRNEPFRSDVLRDPGKRRQMVELVDFYRSRGFRRNSERTMRKVIGA